MKSVRWLEALWRSSAESRGTWITLRGSSMEPQLGDGDALLVVPLAGGEPPRPGEILVARRGRRLVTHRLVDLREGIATTRGDSCPSVDPPLPADALLARVVQVKRGPKDERIRRAGRCLLAWLRRAR